MAQYSGVKELIAMWSTDFVKVKSGSIQSNIGPHVCVKTLRRYASLRCDMTGAAWLAVATLVGDSRSMLSVGVTKSGLFGLRAPKYSPGGLFLRYGDVERNASKGLGLRPTGLA